MEVIEKAPLLNLIGNVDYRLMDIIESLTTPSDKILDISCGNGSDSFELLKRGYDVCSTEHNQKYFDYVSNKMNCVKHDTRKKFPFRNNEFDLVYCRLGLHYFKEEELIKIFNDISRITSGYLVFIVKIQQDDLATGKVMLSSDVWEKLTSNSFKILNTDIKNGVLYNYQSKWLEIIASKINK